MKARKMTNYEQRKEKVISEYQKQDGVYEDKSFLQILKEKVSSLFSPANREDEAIRAQQYLQKRIFTIAEFDEIKRKRAEFKASHASHTPVKSLPKFAKICIAYNDEGKETRFQHEATKIECYFDRAQATRWDLKFFDRANATDLVAEYHVSREQSEELWQNQLKYSCS